MQKTIALKCQIQWRATHSTQSDRWIGICEPMNMALEADSLDELHSVIDEAMQLLFLDLLEDNELDAYLRSRGWETQIPAVRNAGDVRFDVPWELIASNQIDREQRTH